MRYSKGILTKSDINKRGYNKFLSISSGITVNIDEERIKEDAMWDGLKGYKTNTDLSPGEVYEAIKICGMWNGRSVLPRGHRMSDRCSTSRIEESKRMYTSVSLH